MHLIARLCQAESLQHRVQRLPLILLCCRILYKLGRQADLQTELSGTEMQWLDSITLEQLMLSFREITSSKQASQYRGVSLAKSKTSKQWHSRMQQAGKNLHLGYFDSEIDAAEAFDRKAIDRYGRLVFIHAHLQMVVHVKEPSMTCPLRGRQVLSRVLHEKPCSMCILTLCIESQLHMPIFRCPCA